MSTSKKRRRTVPRRTAPHHLTPEDWVADPDRFGIPAALARYYAEIYAIEDEWYAQRHGDERMIGGSLWARQLDMLGDVDRRHGVLPDDSRVYSIAAFKAESRAIDERYRPLLESGGDGPRDWEQLLRYASQVDDCRARHFPGVFDVMSVDAGRVGYSAVNTIPKLWAWVTFQVGNLPQQQTIRKLKPDEKTLVPVEVERVYGLMDELGIPGVPEPPYPELTPGEVINLLSGLANRLERQEAQRMAEERPADIAERPGQAENRRIARERPAAIAEHPEQEVDRGTTEERKADIANRPEQEDDGGIPDAGAGSAPTSGEDHSPSGYLGLRFDDGRRTVERFGYAVTVPVAGRNVFWGLLLALFKSKETYLRMDEARAVWGECGLAADPENHTITDAISDLRRLLKPLGVKIKNAHRNGWRLEDDTSTEPQGPA